MEIDRVLRNDEIVVLSVNEESWDVGLFDVISDRVEVLDAELVLTQQRNTFYLMVDLRKLRAIPLNIDKPPPCFSASSFDSF